MGRGFYLVTRFPPPANRAKRGKQPSEKADAGRERRRRLAERGVPLDRGVCSGKKMTAT